MKTIFLLLSALVASAQPYVKILPPTNFKVVGTNLLFFDLVLTNAGTRTLTFTDRPLTRGGRAIVPGMFEAALHDFRGRVVRERITEAGFAFRKPDRPAIKPRERVAAAGQWGGVLDVSDVAPGVYVLEVRLNPDGRRWPSNHFQEEGAFVPILISRSGDAVRVVPYKPPRPVLAYPKPPPEIVAAAKARRGKPPPLPEGGGRGKAPLYRGRGMPGR